MALTFAGVVGAQTKPLKPFALPCPVPMSKVDDITIPMEGGGSIIIQDPRFWVNSSDINRPELRFSLHNQSTVSWSTVILQSEIGDSARVKSGDGPIRSQHCLVPAYASIL